METKTGFLEESPGNKSITRLIFTVIVLAAIYIAIYQVHKTGHMDTVSFSTMVGIAATLKVTQKSIENKSN